MILNDQLFLPDNVIWAWQKVQRAYSYDRTWFNALELAQFEMTLHEQIDSIIEDFRSGTYRVGPAKPIPFPKKKEEDGTRPTRQMFWFSVRDQVAWMALINVIGQDLDALMPPWSYGDRLYRTTWFDQFSDHLHIGPYRNSRRHFYRAFKNSWPRYRRHIFLTVRQMASSQRKAPLEEHDEKELNQERLLSRNLRVPYLDRKYWPGRNNSVFWAGLDLRKFFPRTPISLVLANIRKTLGSDGDLAHIYRLVESMLEFSIDTREWSVEDRKELDLPDDGKMLQIPTGLLVAGFLANVALLGVDHDVAKRIRTEEPSNHNIAHFRYVDDHVILGTTADAVLKWITEYEGILQRHNRGWEIGMNKTEPKELREYLSENRSESPRRLARLRKNATTAMKLNPAFPSPLLTQTLTRISTLNSTPFELLDGPGRQEFLENMKLLMLGDISPQEVREDTRVSFAASRLARFGPRLDHIGDPAADPAKENARIFLLLKEAARKYPAKLSLATQPIVFCAATGIDMLDSAIQTIVDNDGLNELTRTYVRAVAIHTLSTHAIHSWKRATDDTFPIEERMCAFRYMIRAFQTGRIFSSAQDGRWYERQAWAVFCGARAAIGLCAMDKNEFPKLPPKIGMTQPLKSIASRPEWNITKSVFPDARWWQRLGTPSPEAWIWWAENETSPETTIEPGPVAMAALKEKTSTGFMKHIIERFPAHVPIRTFARNLPSVDAGWYFDAVQRSPETGGPRNATEVQALRQSARRAPVRSVLNAAIQKATSSPKGMQSVHAWVLWQREQLAKAVEDTNRHNLVADPRLGEWTALALAKVIVDKITPLQADTRPCLHPTNFLIPLKWNQLHHVTWEPWRKEVQGVNIKIERRPLIDKRYGSLNSEIPAYIEDDWPWIRGTGLLLLGLLQKNFLWPALWNPSMNRQAHDSLTRRLLESLPCSSYAMAITEACLLSHGYESFFLFHLKQDTSERDTQLGPLYISSLRELSNHLQKALTVLKAHQMVIQGHHARQLIPLSLKQLTHQEWAMFAEDYEGADN